jgi:hypothetical protein
LVFDAIFHAAASRAPALLIAHQLGGIGPFCPRVFEAAGHRAATFAGLREVAAVDRVQTPVSLVESQPAFSFINPVF